MAGAKRTAKKRVPASAAKKRTAKRSAASPVSKKASLPKTRKPKAAARRKKFAASLGRVRVPVDARLDLVFQKDYQVREIFDFLKVETIRELEEFAPMEIIERLTGPLVQTVERIRKMLALANRHLAKDEKFAKSFLAEVRKHA